jgi:hypothetical protein
MPTQYGITYTVSDLTPHTATINSLDENTTITLNIDNVVLNYNADTTGDPDVIFNNETSIFQYVLDDYLEGNPGLVNNRISSYVGQFYSDTVLNEFTIFDTIEDGVGTRFSSSELSFDSSSMRFDRRTT